MSTPAWSSVDDDTADILTLVATPSPENEAARAAEEWAEFARCLRFAADERGLIAPNALRRLVRGNVKPCRVGAFTNRALSQGLVAYTGDWQISDDTEGRNGGKPARVMRLLTPT